MTPVRYLFVLGALLAIAAAATLVGLDSARHAFRGPHGSTQQPLPVQYLEDPPAPRLDAKHVGEQVELMRAMQRSFRAARSREEQEVLMPDYLRLMHDGSVLAGRLKESLPGLDGRESEQGIDLSREPDMVIHFIDLLEVLTQMHEDQQSNQLSMPHYVPAARLLVGATALQVG